MDPYEKKLRDEVLYLHNLWHQGPPPSIPSFQNPNSIQFPPPSIPSFQNPNSIQFPPPFPSNSYNNSRFRKRSFSNGDPPPVSCSEWPVPAQTWEDTPGWPALKRNLPPAAQPLSAEDRSRLAALKLQQKALEASRQFFKKMDGSDGEEEEEEGEESELGFDCSDGEEGSGESEAHRFFMAIFVDDSELRSYYEKNYEGGEFYCLVCAGIGKKVWKRFKDCVGLIQHSTTISNTKKKLSHRAFGHAVCKVLGWDMDRIPVIEMKGQPLSHTLGESQGVPEDRNANQDSNADALHENNSKGVSNGGCETCLHTSELVSVPAVDCVDSEEQDGLMVREKVDAAQNSENTEKSSLDMGANEVVNCVGSEPLEVSGIHENHSTAHQACAEGKESPLVQFNKALECCRIFFAGNANSDELKDGDGNGMEECEEFKFLVKVFKEDDVLRKYHEKEGEVEGGEFLCLVCGGIGKRFKGCRGLLQHVITISKREQGRAHMAYGHVICKLLDWDISTFPVIG